MNDAAAVRRRETCTHLPCDCERAVLRKAADSFQKRRQVLAVDVLHGQEGVAVHFVDVVHAADVRM
jgi:hypothetical protein